MCVQNGTSLRTYADSDDRQSYEGPWVGGKRRGRGKVVYRNGRIVTGMFLDNEASGVFRKMVRAPPPPLPP